MMMSLNLDGLNRDAPNVGLGVENLLDFLPKPLAMREHVG